MLTLLPESLFESPSDDVTRRERERPFGARVDDPARVVKQVAETVKKKVGQGAVPVTPDTIDDAVRQQSEVVVNAEFNAGRLPFESLGQTRDALQSQLKMAFVVGAFEVAGGVTGGVGFLMSHLERDPEQAQNAESKVAADSASKDSTEKDSAANEDKQQKGSSKEPKAKRRVWQVV